MRACVRGDVIGQRQEASRGVHRHRVLTWMSLGRADSPGRSRQCRCDIVCRHNKLRRDHCLTSQEEEISDA